MPARIKVTVQLLEALRRYRRAGLNLPYDEVLLKAELLRIKSFRKSKKLFLADMLRKEDLLIRQLSCLSQDFRDIDTISRLLNSKLDWDYIFVQAREKGVISLLYKTLLSIKNIEKSVPQDILQAMKNTYYSTIKRNMLIFSMLDSITLLFKSQGLDLIILKGPLLIELVYKDMGLRPMADLDILVKKQELAKIDALLKNNGYSSAINIEEVLKSELNSYRDSISYQNKIGPQIVLHLDLHWHIVNLLPYHCSSNAIRNIDMDKIWKDSIEIKFGEKLWRTFSVEHQIICLCLHTFKHSYRPLIGLCDINGFLRVEKEKINWDILVKEAVNCGLSKYVYYGLYLASQVLKTDIPQDAIDRLKPKRMSLFEKKFINSILQARPIFTDRYAVFFVYFGMKESLTERFIFLRDVLLPGKKYLSFVTQKKASSANIREYIRRVNIGFNCAARFLFHRNLNF